ncbi:hypothetical protein E2C01_095263 [Portunus trituberculatus]|uniref:Uncharacterized protein n=1 Tax=Portunus trituberculatus TaxID=210409 RepID=A0A5B7JZQ5_PORTR|nr:hypothetical protein [Portunus trituberculatus]
MPPPTTPPPLPPPPALIILAFLLLHQDSRYPNVLLFRPIPPIPAPPAPSAPPPPPAAGSQVLRLRGELLWDLQLKFISSPSHFKNPPIASTYHRKRVTPLSFKPAFRDALLPRHHYFPSHRDD